MKILLVTGIFPPDIGGPATFVPNLGKYLENRGHEVRILTLAKNTKKQSNDEFRTIRIQRKLPKLVRMFLVIAAIVFTPRDFKVFANGLHEEVGLSQLLKKRLSVAKIVGDPVWERSRNIGTTKLNIIDFNKSKESLSTILQRRLLVFSLNKFTAITAPSLELCDLIRNWKVTKRIEYIANGTKLKEFKETPKYMYDLICVSRLVSWKNIKIHINIASDLGLSLAIVGTGPEESELKDYAKEKKCDATFFGEKEKNEIECLLRESKVFILMSEYEGLSFSLLEAMSIGLPAIVSDIPANSSVIRDAKEGLIVEINNWESSREEIKSLFYDDDQYRLFSAGAKKRVEDDFNEFTQFAKTEKLLAL